MRTMVRGYAGYSPPYLTTFRFRCLALLNVLPCQPDSKFDGELTPFP